MEVLFGGFWGPVCSDFWDIQDANVFCRQLGRDGALAAPIYESFGEGNEEICLGFIQCRGNESSILHCPHDEWTVSSGDGEIPAGQSIAICTPAGLSSYYVGIILTADRLAQFAERRTTASPARRVLGFEPQHSGFSRIFT